MKKKKWRDIRNAVTMMCVMVAMLSTATYAWFTLTSNPVVNGLQMTAASSEGLKISKDHTNWFNAIDMNEMNTVDNVPAVATFTNMYPATLLSKALINSGELNGVPQFYQPHYEGFTVDSTTAITTKSTFNSYVASCTYYLKNEASSGTVNVGIMTVDQTNITASDIGVTDGNPNVEGSFVKIVKDGDSVLDADGNDTNADSGNDHSAVEAVRIALVIDNQTVVVYEPNSGTTLKATSTYAINGLVDSNGDATNITPDVVSTYENGKITSSGATGDYVSQGLFTIDAGDYVQVDMYVWFEGQDPQCVDQIMKDLIEVQLQFTAVD